MATLTRPLLITEDSEVIDTVVRIAVARAGEVLVCAEQTAVRGAWMHAPLVLVGADCAAEVISRGLPNRGRIVVVTCTDDRVVWEQAVRLRAEHVVRLPDGERWLADALADCAEGPPRDGCVLAVVGGAGGVGASTFAATLALTAAQDGRRSLLIDGDPLGGGLDLLLGVEEAAGARWSAIDPGPGRLSPAQLDAALPHVGSVALLSADSPRAAEAPVVASVVDAGRRGFDAVVIDCPPPGDAHIGTWVAVADRVIVIASAHVHGASATARVLQRLAGLGVHPEVVVAERAKGVPSEEVASALGITARASIPFIPSMAGRADEGDVPVITSAYARECRLVLS
jgi:secretion/DNA translocation related CpaE-like protein